ncbi:hypothetical protein E5A44_25160 [Salmonella enterica subsp. enterica serovar Lubbock]|uniref:Uncharacterized protein n=3 Tax=Salmonella enterica I TaxID=59201 RepID=A0A3W0QB44_SALET|nr:hypothetical protein CE137_07395 [Salmonella enterica subsp. enterica serovar Waycross]AYJ53779.1 hypothetical protein D8S86_07945 [Salmonella enterica subsp. enterica serovar Mbandaka]AYJ63063.1 hypothetical protein D8S90_07950 [Salmonella enterica subsp. enterica serovar Lubbock]EAA5788862.1 hypothetical protein [Salmonella enterica subsp. enterica]EAB3565911.1 hypothetical protein [Salmonella enterica]EAB8449399.1 hypothetical protein [Salmonella enterica subsp. enterica serovar Carmel]
MKIPRNAGHFYIRSKCASHARLLNTEPFRMTLEDAGLVIGAFLWAGILCDKVHHLKVITDEVPNSYGQWCVRSC